MADNYARGANHHQPARTLATRHEHTPQRSMRVRFPHRRGFLAAAAVVCSATTAPAAMATSVCAPCTCPRLGAGTFCGSSFFPGRTRIRHRTMRGCAAWRCHVLACAGPEAALSGAGGSSGGLRCGHDSRGPCAWAGQPNRRRLTMQPLPRRPAPSRRTDTRGQRHAPRRIEVLRPWRAWTGPARGLLLTAWQELPCAHHCPAALLLSACLSPSATWCWQRPLTTCACAPLARCSRLQRCVSPPCVAAAEQRGCRRRRRARAKHIRPGHVQD